MKKLIFLALVILFTATGQVSADTQTRVRIETPDKTIFDNTVSVPDSCTIKDKDDKEHKLTGAKAACALDAASKSGGFNYEFASSSFGLFLEKVSSYTGSANSFWVYRVNYKMPPVGMAEYTVASNDHLLISFGSDPLLPLKVELDKTTLRSDQDLVATVLVWDDGKGSFQPTSGASVYLGSTNYTTGSDGKVTIHQPKAGNYAVYALKQNQVRSEKVSLEVTPALTPSPTPTPTSTSTPTPTSIPTKTPTPIPTSGQVAGANDDLPNTGPGETYLIAMLLLLTGVYFRGKKLITI